MPEKAILLKNLIQRGGMKILPLCFLWAWASFAWPATSSFRFKERHIQALNHLHRYELDAMRQQLSEGPVDVYLAQLARQYEMLFGAAGTQWEQERKGLEQSMAYIESQQADPYQFLFLADLCFYQAVARLRAGHLYRGAQLLLKAHKFNRRGQEQFPDEPFFAKWTAVYAAAVGSIPSSYQWIAAPFGIEPAKESALQSMRQLVDRNFVQEERLLWKKECQVLLAYMTVYLAGDVKKGSAMLQQALSTQDQGPVADLLRNSMDFKLRKASAVRKRRKPVLHSKVPLLAYQSGLARLYALDTACKGDFLQFIRLNQSGQMVKSSWEKLAWMACIQNNETAFRQCLKHILQDGEAHGDEDKHALAFAHKGAMPDQRLLRLRLLYDGGYDQQAMQLVKNMHYSAFDQPENRVEYLYRKGRIYQALQQDEVAFKFYRAAMLNGWEQESYYAMKSAVLIAGWYEKKGQVAAAREYYQKALSNKACKDYRNSLEQLAKSGLQRL